MVCWKVVLGIPLAHSTLTLELFLGRETSTATASWRNCVLSILACLMWLGSSQHKVQAIDSQMVHTFPFPVSIFSVSSLQKGLFVILSLYFVQNKANSNSVGLRYHNKPNKWYSSQEDVQHTHVLVVTGCCCNSLGVRRRKIKVSKMPGRQSTSYSRVL